MGFLVRSSIGSTWIYPNGCSQLGGWLGLGEIDSLGHQPIGLKWMAWATCMSILRAGFMSMIPVQSQRAACSRRPHALSLMLCYHHLKIYNNFIFGLVSFKCKSYRTPTVCSRGNSINRHVHCSLRLHVHTYNVQNARRGENPGGLMIYGSSTWLKVSTR